nr:methyltransferase domain-containing protein [Eubacterium sp.]
GLLDTGFGLGNFEDNDLGVRLANAGYDNVLCHNSFIFHLGNESFNRNKLDYTARMTENEAFFHGKWGFSPMECTPVSQEAVDMIASRETAKQSAPASQQSTNPSAPASQQSTNPSAPAEILEIGCRTGNTLAHLKYLYPAANVRGTEASGELCKLAARKVDVLPINPANDTLPFEPGTMDYVLIFNSLEEVMNPDRLLELAIPLLKPDGRILLGCHNFGNISVLHKLVSGSFAYEKDGIMSHRHLHHFTFNDLLDLFERHRLIPEGDVFTQVNRPYSTAVEPYRSLYESIKKLPGTAPGESFDIYRFAFMLRKA